MPLTEEEYGKLELVIMLMDAVDLSGRGIMIHRGNTLLILRSYIDGISTKIEQVEGGAQVTFRMRAPHVSSVP